MPVDVFTPAPLGPITLRNRTIKAATYENMARGGLVTDDLVDFHARTAAGGVGMTTVAYCAVTPDGRTDDQQITWQPESLPGLHRLTEAVHAHGAAVSAQIGHAGPVADSHKTRAPALAPSRFPSPSAQGMTRAADRDDLQRVIEAHAAAAIAAADVGFDAVEIHLGHNYLASSFLSPLLNRRRDEYGGSLANRARLALEIVTAVRTAVGRRIAVTAKLNLDDGVPGGFSLEEAITVARWLEETAALDALELTAGSSLLNPMYLFHGDVPLREFAAALPQPTRTGVRLFGRALLRHYPYRPGYLLDSARQVRAAVRLPLILLGGITDRTMMDTAMAEGFQFVAMGRALLREPDLIHRLQADPQTRSLCTHCNKCMPTIFHRTRCVLAPEAIPWRTAADPDQSASSDSA